MINNGKSTFEVEGSSGVRRTFVFLNTAVRWEDTSLMEKSLRGRITSLSLTFGSGLRPCMGIPVFTDTEHLSFMIQQQQSVIPALRLETGWSLEGFTSWP
jgi:hypothetical protein